MANGDDRDVDRPASPLASEPGSSAPAVAPPWFQDGVRFGCTRCGACCRSKGYLWLSPPDIARLADFLGLSIDEFRARHTRDVVVGGDRGVSVNLAAHGCRFLDDATNQCTVHPARPTQCRTFPFWPMIMESREVWQREVTALCGSEALEQGPVYTVDEILRMSSRIVAARPVPPEA